MSKPAILITALLLFFNAVCFAEIADDAGPLPTPKREFIIDNKKVPPGGECERVLIAAETKLKREFTTDEIRALLPKILQRTQETLLSLAPPKPVPVQPRPKQDPEPRFNCFTASMMVATPFGEKPISSLKSGDEVLSINHSTGKWISNRIHKLLVTPEQKFGTLNSLDRPLEVTDSERFYTNGGVYLPLRDLSASSTLFLPQLGPNGQLRFDQIPRGIYNEASGCGTVFNLELVDEPRNFIINGVLVHNIRIKG